MQSIIPVAIDIAPPSYGYVIDYWKEHYACVKEAEYLYKWLFTNYELYTGQILFDREIKIYKYHQIWDGEDCDITSWTYNLSNWCEQDFQDILSPTLNELVLFEIKYGFEFPFQEKNMKYPIMTTI